MGGKIPAMARNCNLCLAVLATTGRLDISFQKM